MKTEKEIDALLREALAPDQEPKENWKEDLVLVWKQHHSDSPDENLNQKKEGRTRMMSKRRKAAVVAAAAACLLTVSVTAAAAVKYLSRDEVISEMKDTGAKEAFETGEVLEVEQTQEAGDYRFRLYAVATKEELESDGFGETVKSGKTGGTYAVLAIDRLDGTPMPATSSEEYADLNFFVSPLIQGLQPWNYNIASMGGSYGEMEKDGVLYRILECDDIALFADRQIYLCITDSVFYRTEAYHYEEADGTITRNEDYEGINVLFELPLDPARADSDKAEEYLEALEKRWSE